MVKDSAYTKINAYKLAMGAARLNTRRFLTMKESKHWNRLPVRRVRV